MTTYTRTQPYGYTCDDCGLDVGSHWRNLATHTAVHNRADQLTARAARVKAMTGETRCAPTGFGLSAGVETDRLGSGNNEPASAQTLTGSSTPLVLQRKEA